MDNHVLFQKQIEKLKQSPVFTMSLGSKELFHSNFWAFLMEHNDYKALLFSLFPELDSSKTIEIRREYKNRDIVIINNEKEYVIENKIKSYPDLDQLKRYGEDKNMSFGIVTGINEPPFELPKKWRYVSYSSIAKILREIESNNKYLESIVEEYCEVLDSINTLMSLSLKETEGRLSYWTPTIALLDDVRLMDVFRKLKADDFAIQCSDINTEANELLNKHNGWEFYISRSFHNGKATLSFELLKYVNQKYKGQIGIQIEDNQFRLFLGLAEGTNRTINEIFTVGVNLGWFDKSFDKKTNRKIFGLKTSMSKNPCSYSGRWVYQYFDTWSKNDQDIQSYQDLKTLIRDYLVKAISIIDAIDESLF